MPIRVTAIDTETGDTQTMDIPEHSYIVVCAGDCHITNEQRYPMTGTVELTIKVGPLGGK